MSHYYKLIEAILNANSIDEFHKLCTTLCQDCEFEYFIYGVQFLNRFMKPQLIVINGYPPEWYRHYEDQGYVRVDPVVEHCYSRNIPLVWEDIRPLEDTNTKIRMIMSEARDFGLRSGVSFPIHGHASGWGLLSLASNKDPKDMRARIVNILPYIQLITGYLQEAVLRLCNNTNIQPIDAQLTGRERECLLWAAEGKTAWEISQILHISERTVIFHLQNATHKLNVSNRQQAVAKAVSYKLIMPQIIMPQIGQTLRSL